MWCFKQILECLPLPGSFCCHSILFSFFFWSVISNKCSQCNLLFQYTKQSHLLILCFLETFELINLAVRSQFLTAISSQSEISLSRKGYFSCFLTDPTVLTATLRYNINKNSKMLIKCRCSLFNKLQYLTLSFCTRKEVESLILFSVFQNGNLHFAGTFSGVSFPNNPLEGGIMV